MTRRSFVALAAVAARADGGRPHLLVLTRREAGAIRDWLRRDERRAAALRGRVQKALTEGPWSVTHYRPPAQTAAPNDYYSEAPYWWPDPKNPGGPYIRRDGERNPGRFVDHRRDLGEMAEAVLALGMGALFLDDARCAARARRVLAVWFLDPKTRMNPHLEFGQAVRGRNTGRGAGIIDTVSLIYAVQGALLLEEAGGLDTAAGAALRRWVADYLRWMTTSEKGLAEKKAGNNHATWWTAQAASFAAFAGDAESRRMAWAHYRDWLVPRQVRADGSCPAEEARTRSLHYSAMNLDGFAVICRQAELEGMDLWRYRTAAGIGVEKSFSYLMPYVLEPKKWVKQQITPFEQDRPVFLAMAGLGLRSAALLGAYHRLPRADAPWVQLADLLARPAEFKP